MKKSYRMYQKARAATLLATLTCTTTIALLIWAIVASLHHSLLTLPAWTLTAIGAVVTSTYIGEAVIWFKSASREEANEWRMMFRPRL